MTLPMIPSVLRVLWRIPVDEVTIRFCRALIMPKVSNKREPPNMDQKTKNELEAAAFRGLIEHLQRRTDVQNIDLMNLAGFCRNCLSKWYMNAAKEHGIELSYDDARQVVYGMTYDEWKSRYQKEASAEQLKTFEDTKPMHAFVSGHNKT